MGSRSQPIIREIEAIPLSAMWEELYGGMEHVPPSLLRPSSHFQSIPRLGQFSTVVKVTDSDGLVGIGEAWGLPHADITATIVRQLLRPVALGRSAEDIDGLWELFVTSAESLGHTRGFMLEAISGLDIALWDLRGKRAGLPLSGLLGGRLRERIDCYASPIRFSGQPADTIENALEFTSLGFRGVKIKAGRTVEQDVAYVAAVREALGPDLRILIDFNCAYDTERTIAFAKEVEPLDIYWLEEPVPPDHVEAYEEIRRRSPIRISAGENDFSVQQFRQLIEKGAVDVINPNVTRAGGVTGVRRIQAISEANGVDIAMHGVGGGIMMAASLQLMSTFRNGLCMEYNRFPNPLREELVLPPIAFSEGTMGVPEGIGLGCILQDEVVARFRSRSSSRCGHLGGACHS
ncbi:mandelate racemase/muconate lactonizing enzyme family protein [Paenibacillus koleovorans]|uniref:mandelate racemase/muconate lactonizing enzyme family protein n=1 Tax=Paenibacillus koleovorans TaxID=121608 RepID=UPI000FDBDF12|nr:mandelate racemase/muconate lactonizing enzyme family protein [Paenibacillus koleovorans]